MRKLIRTTSPVERVEEMSIILRDFTRHLNQVWYTRQEKDATCINSLNMKIQDGSSCHNEFFLNVNISGADKTACSLHVVESVDDDYNCKYCLALDEDAPVPCTDRMSSSCDCSCRRYC